MAKNAFLKIIDIPCRDCGKMIHCLEDCQTAKERLCNLCVVRRVKAEEARAAAEASSRGQWPDDYVR
jgi:hypothetical protein